MSLNGTEIGTVWTAPFAVDITSHLRPGKNDLELLVTNTWWNRLVADTMDDRRQTQLTGSVLAPDAPYRKWGLTGPISVSRSAPAGITNAN